MCMLKMCMIVKIKKTMNMMRKTEGIDKKKYDSKNKSVEKNVYNHENMYDSKSVYDSKKEYFEKNLHNDEKDRKYVDSGENVYSSKNINMETNYYLLSSWIQMPQFEIEAQD
ncbi:hypothetical protein HOY82DRAFT_544248 [Tuber indicum]|nr:hypothetical protein HOY82DRAFT_544248 [Tuber indicum]